MTPEEFDGLRAFVNTPEGKIAYVEKGDGPVAVFVHAYALNGYQWRHALDELSSIRRCIAIDVLAMGHTEAKRDQDLSLKGQAQMLGSFLDALGIDEVDLIGNDSGGGVCQVFAARNPNRVRTMTLTNSEAHDNYPPEGLMPLIGAAQGGALAGILQGMIAEPDTARANMGVALYENAETAFSDELVNVYLAPLVRSEEAADDFTRYTATMNPESTVEIEELLKELDVPTLLIWGNGDPIFPLKWAEWLHATLPRCEPIVEVTGGKLCWPEEHPEALIENLRRFWSA